MPHSKAFTKLQLNRYKLNTDHKLHNDKTKFYKQILTAGVILLLFLFFLLIFAPQNHFAIKHEQQLNT